MAQLFGKTIIPINARRAGTEFHNEVSYPLIIFEWENETHSFACVEKLGQYLSVNTDGVVDKRFAIQSTMVEDLFKAVIAYHPTIR